MNRGELPLVNLDDRTWQELVDQTKALIPTYAPEWTDNGPADLGITLIELFAWLIEGMQYRLNRVPDRTYVALLNLMGILRTPPNPASTMLTFSLAKEPALLVKRFQPIGSLQTEQQGTLIFETDEDVEVLPNNLRWAMQVGPDGSVQDVSRNLIVSPLSGWKFRLPKSQSVSLWLGFDSAPTKEFSLKLRPPAFQYQLPTTFLAGAIEPGSLTLTVVSGAGFPNVLPFTIQIDSEQMSVTKRQLQNVTNLSAVLKKNDTTMTVASPAGFPTTFPFSIQIGSEQISVTAGTPTTNWTIQRGQNGTAAVEHSINSAVILPSIWTVVRGQGGTTASAHSLNAEVTVPAVALTWSYPIGPSTTLTDEISDTSTILNVASEVGFPTPPFNIQIENEEIQVSEATTATSWKILRAQNGSSSSIHSKKAVVTLSHKAIGKGEVKDGSNALRRAGSVYLPKLDNWVARPGRVVAPTLSSEEALATQEAYWLQLKITANSSFDVSMGLDFLLANSVSASHVVSVPVEKPEQAKNITPNAPDTTVASDQPWQRFELKNRPLYREPNSQNPYSHLRVDLVEPSGTSSQWEIVEDFPKGFSKSVRLDPVAGTLLFGDYDAKVRPDGVGMIPPAGSKVLVSYRAVAGGKIGNVPPGVLVTVLPRPGNNQRPSVSVTNPGIGVGGADEESIEDTKRRAPDVLRVRNRAVSAEDYASLAREASILVKKSAALSPPSNWQEWEGRGGLQRRPGFVNVLIVPDAPPTETQPFPSAALIDEVRAYLDERRVVSTSLAVLPPRYAPVAVTLAVKLFPGPGKDANLKDSLSNRLRERIKDYLHPLLGGPKGQGWEIGETLFVSGLFAALEPIIDAQGFVEQLTVALNPRRPVEDDRLIKANVDKAIGLPVLDFELICSAADSSHNVTVDFLT